jgi:hypothetical protein
MATINLGAIKFNWKGAYNSSTSYAVDDVVSSGGNSYICIQAHSNQAVGDATAYWNIMSSAGTNGTNGTDLTSTLTTQGDILYRDGSGLQRLGKPTSNKILQNTSGGVLSYIDAPVGGLVQVKHVATTTQHNLASSSFQDLNNMSLAITPTSASNKIFMMFGINGYTNVSNRGWKARIVRGSTTIFEEPEQKATYAGSSSITARTMYHYLDSPNTTSATTYKAQVHQDGGGEVYYQYGGSQSFITLMEVSV